MPFPVIPILLATGLYVLHGLLEEKPNSQAQTGENVNKNNSSETDPVIIANPANTVPESGPDGDANSVPNDPPNPPESDSNVQ